MRKFITLVRCELWEHHNLWRVPLILLALVVLANAGFSGAASWLGMLPPELSTDVLGAALGSLGSLVYFVFTFLVLFYLVDCLYIERKDKSILFWRSLPVSDTLAVAAKLFVAALLIPVIIWLTIVAAQVLTLLFQWMGSEHGQNLFGIVSLGTYWCNLLLVLLLTSLWSLPLMSWFLFCSSWAKRTPLITALSIPAVLILLNRIFPVGLDVSGLIAARIPFGFRFGGSEQEILLGLLGLTANRGEVLEVNAFKTFLLQPDLWAGLFTAGIFFAMTVWTRRWRDDS